MAISVDPSTSPRIITILQPLTTISVQDLTDQIKDWEDEPADLSYPILVLTFGKQALGGGAFVGITAVLQNAQIAFEARDNPPEIACTVTGGNLVAVDDVGASIDPVYPTANTHVTIQQSTSPSIITPAEDLNMLYLIESLRGPNKSLGSIFYWDPENGDDSLAGTQPSTAVKTFAQANTLVTAGNHDTIFCLATDTTNNVTTVTEVININKDTTKLRGPGYTFQFKPAAGSAPVTISGDDVEFSGFYVEPNSGGSDNGISVTGNRALIKDCWINAAPGNGINITGSTRTIVDTCAIENSGGDGISIGASTALSRVKTCIITGSGSDGISLSGSSVTDNIFENNLIYNNTGYGINISAASVDRTGVRMHHTLAQNTAGNINDQSTTTIYDTTGAIGAGDIADIADAVWDEVISSSVHAGASSAGKTLRDAKTKATLASLK